MPLLTVTDPASGTSPVAVEAGHSLMEGLKDAGVDIAAICGGACSCATCHVHLEGDWAARLPPPDAAEQELLADLPDYQPGRSRLSCQIMVDAAMDGMALTLVP